MYLWFVVRERRPLFDDVLQPHVMYTFQIKIYWKVTSLLSFEKTIYFIFERTLYCFDLSDGYFKVRFLQPMYLLGIAEKSKWIFSYILNSLFLKTRPRDNVSYDMDLDVLCLLFNNIKSKISQNEEDHYVQQWNTRLQRITLIYWMRTLIHRINRSY